MSDRPCTVLFEDGTRIDIVWDGDDVAHLVTSSVLTERRMRWLRRPICPLRKQAIPDGFLTPNDVSKLLGVPMTTLKTWRKRSTRLQYFKFGRLVGYAAEDVTEFAAYRERERARKELRRRRPAIAMTRDDSQSPEASWAEVPRVT